jgi:NADPH:quinone reductase-like Zn-dependent oxidoreductase
VYPLNCERLAVRRARLFISLALAAGALRPIVDRVFPLERALEAYAYLDSGEQRGKVVLETGIGSRGAAA